MGHGKGIILFHVDQVQVLPNWAINVRLSSSNAQAWNEDIIITHTNPNQPPNNATATAKTMAASQQLHQSCTPGSITGSSSVCSGVAGSYSISSVTGATSYTWAYTGTGTASSSTTSVDLTATGAGNLTVTATNSCGTSSAQSMAITISTPTKYVE